jgi:probable selenium-dependent hydroxylase accessory protein YqeC
VTRLTNEGPIARIADCAGARSLVAVTGGGGKTTLLFSLAAYLARSASVVVTTTTRLAADGVENLVVGIPGDDALRQYFAEGKIPVIADHVSDGKLFGPAREEVGAMASRDVADHVLVEADGAKRGPFKAYESHEPVVPRGTTLHIVVVGAEVFAQPASEKNIFRLGLMRDRWGVEPGCPVPFGTVVGILESRDEYLRGLNDVSPEARRLLVVNKRDILPDAAAAEKIADALAGALASYDALLIASLGLDAPYEWRELERRA